MNKAKESYEYPLRLQPCEDRAKTLEWLSIVFLTITASLVYLVMGNSQAMKAALFEDLLALIPPIAFLVVSRIRRRPQSHEYPYGFHRAVTVGFLISAFALTSVGVFLLYDGASILIRQERTTIGTIDMFGFLVWQGWMMIAVMLLASIPLVFIGRAKKKPAAKIHDKLLHSDAEMNAADWKTGFATIVGITGMGAGFWWADAAAAVFISLNILYDGVRSLRDAVGDIMDRRPRTVDHLHDIGLVETMEDALGKLKWVRAAKIRLRENGHVFFGEIAIEPIDEAEPLKRIEHAEKEVYALDWRIRHVAVTLVTADELNERL
ncbi:MAG: cation diffusion facilitator family transporter [Woeseia sp.]